MKASQIIAEEFKKEGIVLAEEVLEKVEHVFAQKVVPRLALEAEEAPVKLIAQGLMILLPAVQPAIEKAMDLNHDGKVGEA